MLAAQEAVHGQGLQGSHRLCRGQDLAATWCQLLLPRQQSWRRQLLNGEWPLSRLPPCPGQPRDALLWRSPGEGPPRWE